jgi:hypothetical protein
LKIFGFLYLFIAVVIISAISCTTAKTTISQLPPSPPIAKIISIEPARAYTGDLVKFNGGGESPGGKLVAYNWTSALDGLLSDQSEFSSRLLSEGRHKIFFSVKDDNGNWSQEVTGEVTISPRIPAPVIDFFRNNPAQIGLSENATISWHVTGAVIITIDNGIGTVNDSGNIDVHPAISTKYTLTASNAGGSSTADLDVIVVPTGNMNLPVIRSFAADPGSIAAGDTANLKWKVDNASAVQIDPGIGSRQPSGSISISPGSTTKYTLTAYGPVGIVIGTTEIVVGQASGPGRADLVLTDIYKIATPDGVRIGYSLENRGNQSSPSTESKLFANGAYKDVVAVPVMPPGGKLEGRFNKWRYDPFSNIIEVFVDAGNNVLESDKTNNTIKFVFPVSVEYDFVVNANLAQWNNGYQPVVFGGSPDNIEGAALYRTNKRLENAIGPAKYLETRPRSTYSGFITGDYVTLSALKPGVWFNAIAGLLEGADAGTVMFEVYVRAEGDTEWQSLGEGVSDIYDYRLRTVSFPIPESFSGKKTDFRLKVSNTGEPLQNWAVWVQARLIR